jgi:hypothetical protein
MSFPYATISSFFEDQGDFEENLTERQVEADEDWERQVTQDLRAIEDDLHPCCVHCKHSPLVTQVHFSACADCEEQGSAQAEDEQAHWEEDPEYQALYVNPDAPGA